MTREVELRRHTDNDGDLLTGEGVEAAVTIGRDLRGGYSLVAASGARRAVQTGGCLLAGLGESVPGGVIVEHGLRSDREEDWRAAYSKAGSGDLESFRSADPNLVSEEAGVLGDGLRDVFARIGDGERALAIGHSPTSEAAVLGLTGEIIAPLGKGEGVVVAESNGEFSVVERLPA